MLAAICLLIAVLPRRFDPAIRLWQWINKWMA
jgi:hypothetical protein